MGVKETGDILASINGAIDKLERQAVRLMERRRTRKRRPKQATAILLNVLGRERVDHEEHQVIETERIPIKPMALEEAIESLDGTRGGIMVFRNPDTERVNVLYRRGDGNLALIEPEPWSTAGFIRHCRCREGMLAILLSQTTPNSCVRQFGRERFDNMSVRKARADGRADAAMDSAAGYAAFAAERFQRAGKILVRAQAQREGAASCFRARDR